MLRSLRSWMSWRRKTTELDPLLLLENQVQQAELLLELRRLELETAQVEAQLMEAQLVLMAKEQERHPRLIQPAEPPPMLGGHPVVMQAPPGPAPTEEPTPDPMAEIAQRIGLSLQPSSSPASES